ncbi:MAG TPA: phosphoribosyltransferase family protein [Arenicellales bacterium]|nr:phosphoribosyltransferase family protein [Arenicellales bacterium]
MLHDKLAAMPSAAPADKLFIEEQDLLLDGYRLGKRIVDSGFRPDFMVGIWRGGSSVGIVVQECLQYFGVETDHISIRTSYRGPSTYHQIIDNAESIRVHGLQYLFETMNADDRFLIVDDVYSTGLNVNAVIERLKQKMRRNMPRDVRIAVPWYKPANNRTGRVPDYYLHETDKWLVLPYELSGLTVDEIYRHKTGLAPIFDELKDYLQGPEK